MGGFSLAEVWTLRLVCGVLAGLAVLDLGMTYLAYPDRTSDLVHVVGRSFVVLLIALRLRTPDPEDPWN